ncbi:hypothetical protein Y032_0277g1108 [Ancylostoma ceylanicum]|uniref:Uncharacterized protein n=1 Tax=Ancylostoma ceylanicum TaxID=53326 RepID=A0A016S780_9BILA|nr:hypothetical protein Y032_0277g1108 [Ancylostoma ceylanicum]
MAVCKTLCLVKVTYKLVNSGNTACFSLNNTNVQSAIFSWGFLNGLQAPNPELEVCGCEIPLIKLGCIDFAVIDQMDQLKLLLIF